MFQFPRLPSPDLCVQSGMTAYNRRRVSPFGNPRISLFGGSPRLIAAKPRPSSARSAKASTVRRIRLTYRTVSACATSKTIRRGPPKRRAPLFSRFPPAHPSGREWTLYKYSPVKVRPAQMAARIGRPTWDGRTSGYSKQAHRGCQGDSQIERGRRAPKCGARRTTSRGAQRCTRSAHILRQGAHDGRHRRTLLAGVRRNRWGWRSPYGDPEKMVLWIQGFRLAEVGFTRRVLGVAWLWERFPSRRQGALGLCAGIRRRGGAGGERPPLDRAVRQSPLG